MYQPYTNGMETMGDEEWKDISLAPKDGTIVDLWIVGPDDTVDFYSPTGRAKKVEGQPLREARTCGWRWAVRPPNPPKWHMVGGFQQPLSPEVTPTHYRLEPDPPRQTGRQQNATDT